MKPVAFTMAGLICCCLTLGACGRAARDDAGRTVPPRTVASKQTNPHQGLDDNPWRLGHLLRGAEARSAERLVERYYRDAATDDGADACRLLLPQLAASIVEDYGEGGGASYLHGHSCREVMAKVFRHVPGQPAAMLAAVRVTGVRAQGDAGFVLLRSPAMPHGEVAVRRSGRGWRLVALIGREATGTPPGGGA
jgi:hypothetical protein